MNRIWNRIFKSEDGGSFYRSRIPTQTHTRARAAHIPRVLLVVLQIRIENNNKKSAVKVYMGTHAQSGIHRSPLSSNSLGEENSTLQRARSHNNTPTTRTPIFYVYNDR